MLTVPDFLFILHSTSLRHYLYDAFVLVHSNVDTLIIAPDLTEAIQLWTLCVDSTFGVYKWIAAVYSDFKD